MAIKAVPDINPKDSVISQSKQYRKVATAARAGDTIGTLETMRDRIAKTIDDPSTAARDLAALTKRLREIMEDLEKLKATTSEEGRLVSVEDCAFSAEAI